MRRTLTAVVVIALWIAAPAYARHDKSPDKTASPDVSGKWTLALEGPAVHGVTTMGLALEQKGTEVSGTFASPHGDMHVEGEFADGTLSLSTTDAEGDQQISFTAKLKEDGSLAGFMSSQMGDMKWTATRVKGK